MERVGDTAQHVSLSAALPTAAFLYPRLRIPEWGDPHWASICLSQMGVTPGLWLLLPHSAVTDRWRHLPSPTGKPFTQAILKLSMAWVFWEVLQWPCLDNTVYGEARR